MTRRQLTLFVDKEDAKEIEIIRHQFNPKQFELIAAHVTLCREDEIKNIDAVLNNLKQLKMPAVIIRFGPVIRFENGQGVLLPAVGDHEQFYLLRSKVLDGLSIDIRRPDPHITLMHPGNSTCTDKIFEQIQKACLPTQLRCNTVSLIEQVNAGPWQTIRSYHLKDIPKNNR